MITYRVFKVNRGDRFTSPFEESEMTFKAGKTYTAEDGTYYVARTMEQAMYWVKRAQELEAQGILRRGKGYAVWTCEVPEDEVEIYEEEDSEPEILTPSFTMLEEVGRF